MNSVSQPGFVMTSEVSSATHGDVIAIESQLKVGLAPDVITSEIAMLVSFCCVSSLYCT